MDARRKKKARKFHSSIEDLVGNEENEYLAPALNSTMINMIHELNDILIEFLKEEIKSKIIELLMKEL
jgi:hypothetical protein